VNAILREVYGTTQSEPKQEPYQLPENLETYFAAKARKDAAER